MSYEVRVGCWQLGILFGMLAQVDQENKRTHELGQQIINAILQDTKT